MQQLEANGLVTRIHARRSINHHSMALTSSFGDSHIVLNANAAASIEALTAHKVMPNEAAPLLTAAVDTAWVSN